MLYVSKLFQPRTIGSCYTFTFRSVTLSEAKQHIRVEHEDDTYIETLDRSRQRRLLPDSDRYRFFLQTRLEATWDGFAPEICLSKPPLHLTPTFVITYYGV